MRPQRLKRIAPHRIEAPQGLVVEAAPCPLQWQSPLFLLGGHSGNPSASRSAAPIKKQPWCFVFAHGLCGRTRQFDHAPHVIYMRAVNFAELFKTAAQCPRHCAALLFTSLKLTIKSGAFPSYISRPCFLVNSPKRLIMVVLCAHAGHVHTRLATRFFSDDKATSRGSRFGAL
ncbi:hypothetical protein TRVL_09937 [Trypanosoma vivax]|nr:hypothetical protein TRVL_09937 [Trypanosoma vivax]